MSFPVLGVIGGGQLARMMAPAATALGVRLRVLAEGADVSATTAAEHVVGDFRHLPTLQDFAATVDVVTFDHEHVPAEHLRALAADGVALHPSPDALQYAQDKLLMRQACERLGLPNPVWAAVSSVAELTAFGESTGWPVILKTPRGGYDGKGVLKVSSPREAQESDEVRDWFDLDFPALLAEQLVPFARELSAQVARTPSGRTAPYPVVESVQTDGVCDLVTAPAPGLDPHIGGAARDAAVALAEGLGVTGMLAVEMFETPGAGPGYLVNELAMRPHNSGHWSMDGAVTGQFEQHVRAVLDLPLGSTEPVGAFTVMKNVLGGANQELYAAFPQAMAAHPQAKLHTYGKSVRPGRKIGHVNVVAPAAQDLEQARRTAVDAAATLREGPDSAPQATRENP